MSTAPTNLPALRRLLAERFPTAMRPAAGGLTTGWAALDEAIGGLPKSALTEVVCSAPSTGGQLLLGQLLRQTREQRVRVALVDATDAFDPQSWPDDLCEHLVWARCHNIAEAMQVADLFARDANLGLIVLDLRHAPLPELRRVPSTQWYRLQRAVEQSDLALLIETPHALVPSAHLRLVLDRPQPLSAQRSERPDLVSQLPLNIQRQRVQAAQIG
jgi:hypothetical protein